MTDTASAEAKGRPSVVALVTDFGLGDPFVGVLHGAILRVSPSARIVDLCHSVGRHDAGMAAFWLERCTAFFPSGSVFCCVVDPGVGSERAVIAGRGAWGYVVAPDNGCLPNSWLSTGEFRRLEDPRSVCSTRLSQTFHGRDLFAPLAAALASGRRAFDSIGPEHMPIRSALVEPVQLGAALRGQVITVDHFGNLLTNISVEPQDLGEDASLSIGQHRLAFRRAYSEVQPGEMLAIINAHGVAEIARRQSSAAKALGLGPGAPATLRYT